jgi:hypothetical protein
MRGRGLDGNQGTARTNKQEIPVPVQRLHRVPTALSGVTGLNS